jgi:hypothetical protein
MDALLIADYTLLATDYMQTRTIAESCHDGTTIELNPLLGRCPSLVKTTEYFAASTAAFFYLSQTLKPEYRKVFLMGLGILETSAVAHNVRLGINIKF